MNRTHPMNPLPMNPLLRWLRFNLVGAMGMALQFAALTLFSHLAPTHDLAASTAALELTLLHNFAWHWRYTWRDRRAGTSWPAALLRFQLSTGMVSLLGNLALLRPLLQQAHLPLLAANLIAIAVCSLINFALSHRWAFVGAEKYSL